MRLIALDESDKIVVEYDHATVKELLIKYNEVLGDVGKSYDQLSEDLLERARTK